MDFNVDNIVTLNEQISEENRRIVIENIIDIFPSNNLIPSKTLHKDRSRYNEFPKGNLICTERVNGLRIFKDDENGWIWREMPWYFNIFHKPWKLIKLLNLDSDHDLNGVSSSEIYVLKSDIIEHSGGIESISIDRLINENSFNYRDFNINGHWKHFLADILPELIYAFSK